MATEFIEKTVEVIMDASERLKCALETRTRALLVYHHFKHRIHEVKYDPYLVAAACLTLSLKYNQEEIEFASVILVFRSITEGVNPTRINNNKFTVMCKAVTMMEFLILRMTEFNLNYTLPFDYLKNLMFILREPLVASNQWDAFQETSIRIASDFCLTYKCLNYKPEQIAVTAIKSSLYMLGINVNNDDCYLKEWIKVFEEFNESTKYVLTNDMCEIFSQVLESDRKK